MKKTFWFTGSLRGFMIIPSCLLLFMLISSLPYARYYERTSLTNWTIASGVIIVLINIGHLISKITLSPEGIEYDYFWIHLKVNWKMVEKVSMNKYGLCEIVLSEPFENRGLVSTLLPFLRYTRTIALLPYIKDLKTSPLLLEMDTYLPDAGIGEFLRTKVQSRKPYQKATSISIFYLGLLSVFVIYVVCIQSQLTLSPYISLLGMLLGESLLYGLLILVLSLLLRFRLTSDLDEAHIAPIARSYYLTPIFILGLSALTGLALILLIQNQSMTLEKAQHATGTLSIIIVLAVFAVKSMIGKWKRS